MAAIVVALKMCCADKVSSVAFLLDAPAPHDAAFSTTSANTVYSFGGPVILPLFHLSPGTQKRTAREADEVITRISAAAICVGYMHSELGIMKVIEAGPQTHEW